MVDSSEAQLYTIEGVSAAILMVVVAYLILTSTYILTPGDTHISDMQLEQLGNDILKMMDTADSYSVSPDPFLAKKSFLEEQLSRNFPLEKATVTSQFIEKFHEFASGNAAWDNVHNYAAGDIVSHAGKTYRANQASTNKEPDVETSFWDLESDNEPKVSANVYYRDGAEIKELDFWDSSIAPVITGREHSVTVTKWVYVNDPSWDPGNPQTILLEVLLWRD